MSLFIRQENERTELQQRIAAELRAKAAAKAKDEAGPTDLPDGVNDSAYLENTKQTSARAWIWILITVLVAGILIWLVLVTL